MMKYSYLLFLFVFPFFLRAQQVLPAPSPPCYLDLECIKDQSDFAGFYHLDKATVRLTIRFPDRTLGSCSGVLLNNLREDGKLYVATANHCLTASLGVTGGQNERYQLYDARSRSSFQVPPTRGGGIVADNNGNPLLQTDKADITATFLHKRTSCGSTDPPIFDVFLRNPRVVVNILELDLALLEFEGPINGEDLKHIYFAGWDANFRNHSALFSLHHAEGAPERFTYGRSESYYSYIDVRLNFRYPTGSGTFENVVIQIGDFINFAPDNGTITQGSSGAGVFNHEGYVVGNLAGGEGAKCPSVEDVVLRVGPFSRAWDWHANRGRNLKDFLDPEGTGIRSMPGRSALDIFGSQALKDYNDLDPTATDYAASKAQLETKLGHIGVASVGSNGVYHEDFETDEGGWFSSGSSNLYWERTQDAALEGDFSFSTGQVNGTGNSYLQSPIFNLPANAIGHFLFTLWYQLNLGIEGEQASGLSLEMSVDGGSWTLVDASGDGWYDATRIPRMGKGWTGYSGPPRRRHHMIPSSSSPRRIRFRFHFSATGSNLAQEGAFLDEFSFFVAGRGALVKNLSVLSLEVPQISYGDRSTFVRFQIANTGQETLRGVNASYVLGQEDPIVISIGDLNPGSVITQTLDLGQIIYTEIAVSVAHTGDQYEDDNSLSASINIRPRSLTDRFPYVADFTADNKQWYAVPSGEWTWVNAQPASYWQSLIPTTARSSHELYSPFFDIPPAAEGGEYVVVETNFKVQAPEHVGGMLLEMSENGLDWETVGDKNDVGCYSHKQLSTSSTPGWSGILGRPDSELRECIVEGKAGAAVQFRFRGVGNAVSVATGSLGTRELNVSRFEISVRSKDLAILNLKHPGLSSGEINLSFDVVNVGKADVSNISARAGRGNLLLVASGSDASKVNALGSIPILRAGERVHVEASFSHGTGSNSLELELRIDNGLKDDNPANSRVQIDFFGVSRVDNYPYKNSFDRISDRDWVSTTRDWGLTRGENNRKVIGSFGEVILKTPAWLLDANPGTVGGASTEYLYTPMMVLPDNPSADLLQLGVSMWYVFDHSSPGSSADAQSYEYHTGLGGMNLQISEDGLNWEVVGRDSESSTSWYDFSQVESLSGASGWAGNSEGVRLDSSNPNSFSLREYKTFIRGYRGKTIFLRWQVSSSELGSLGYGAALDDFYLEFDVPPTGIGISKATIDESAIGGTSVPVGLLSARDQNVDDEHVFTLLSPSSGFEIDGNNLKTTSSLALPSGDKKYDLSIRVQDRTGNAHDEDITIYIQNSAKQPRGISISNQLLREDKVAGTEIGTISVDDPSAGDSHSLSLKTNQDLFELDGKILKNKRIIKRTEHADIEIRIEAKDSEGYIYQEVIVVRIKNVNESPTQIRLTRSTFPEGTDVGDVLTNIEVDDPDGILDRHTFTLHAVSGHDGDINKFRIQGSRLILHEEFNYAVKSSYEIMIRVTDNGGLSLERPFSLEVTDENTSPTDIILSSYSDGIILSSYNIEEGVPVEDDEKSIIGVLSAEDRDQNDSHTFSILGTANQEFFEIAVTEKGPVLRARKVLSYNTRSSYTLKIGVEDSEGADFVKDIVIRVVDINRPPHDIHLSSRVIQSGLPIGTRVGVFWVEDDDLSDEHFLVLLSGDDKVEIVDDALKTKKLFSPQEGGEFKINVGAIDLEGGQFEKTFSINVLGQRNLPPT
ncbi:MAG: cadherin repeat domain-containing protein, partial [Cytophagales bacterium]|nr:cadherin repeat domain-containing protein [Cytophagales bacterium]